MITKMGIIEYLRNSDVFRVEVRREVTSTNTIVRDMAVEGVAEGYVLAAEGQTAGKGRLGRGFYSPASHGVYFSLLLRPGGKISAPALITSAAAVAAAKAIEDVFGVKVGIKWVNDLFIDDKKICGILTEASFDMALGCVESAALGIGINVTTPQEGYPEDIQNKITAITAAQTTSCPPPVEPPSNNSHDINRCRLIAATLDYFWEFYINLSKREFLDEYRLRSIVIGRDVYVVSSAGKTIARAIEIDDDCGLVVCYNNGKRQTLNSGEISILPIARG